MARFYSLFSSSKGNASFVGSSTGGILVDCGVTYTRLMHALEARDIAMEAIQGVLITHTHIDHVRGLRVLLNRLDTKVYAAADVVKSLIRNNYAQKAQIGGVFGAEPMQIGDFTVQAFPLSHDAPGSCGFRMDTPDERCCAVCTDTGAMTAEIYEKVLGCDLVLLEANYDEKMLMRGYYPEHLKKRISSYLGHLSNTQCAEAALTLIEGGTTRIVLGHLSQENNRPNLAEDAVVQHLGQGKKVRGVDYELHIASPNGCPEMVVF